MFFKPTILSLLLLTVSACSSNTSVKVEEDKVAETDKTIQSSPLPNPRMVALHSQYCSVCKKMNPLVDKLIAQCDHKGVRVEKVDVSDEKNERLIDEYGVSGLPTYLFIDEAGYEMARLVGEQTEVTLKQALSILKGEDCPGLDRLLKKVSNAKG
ncbi:MAG: thioredoxin family protein [Proteobacteria bacterium]|nr:thioredoxin family protein [Pseudomonadota bacterium]